MPLTSGSRGNYTEPRTRREIIKLSCKLDICIFAPAAVGDYSRAIGHFELVPVGQLIGGRDGKAQRGSRNVEVAGQFVGKPADKVGFSCAGDGWVTVIEPREFYGTQVRF